MLKMQLLGLSDGCITSSESQIPLKCHKIFGGVRLTPTPALPLSENKISITTAALRLQ